VAIKWEVWGIDEEVRSVVFTKVRHVWLRWFVFCAVSSVHSPDLHIALIARLPAEHTPLNIFANRALICRLPQEFSAEPSSLEHIKSGHPPQTLGLLPRFSIVEKGWCWGHLSWRLAYIVFNQTCEYGMSLTRANFSWMLVSDIWTVLDAVLLLGTHIFRHFSRASLVDCEGMVVVRRLPLGRCTMPTLATCDSNKQASHASDRVKYLPV
jgi:hypothetical protein